MVALSRTRTIDQRCPRCGAQLELIEQGCTTAHPSLPLMWVPVRRHCSQGCPLTADDPAKGDEER